MVDRGDGHASIAGANAGPAPDDLYYDGDCGQCHRFVRFVLNRDEAGDRFRFGALTGESFRAAVPEDVRAQLPDSVVVVTAQGELLVRTAAVLRVFSRLPAPWPLLGSLMRMVPRPLRDGAYDCVAALRHRLFARPTNSCPVPPGDSRGHWLD